MSTGDMLTNNTKLPGNSEMTTLSKEMFESALHIETVEDAVNILMHYRKFRTLKDVLVSFGNGEDIRTVLVDGLMCWQPEVVRENIDRKVRNWINSKTTLIRKQDAFVVSRILKLSLEKTNEFLKLASGEGIHWRNPVDIAWCYAIVQNLEPVQILKLMERVRTLGDTPKAKEKIPHQNLTREVHERLRNVLTEDEDTLIEFLESEWNRLGKFHNTAYNLFVRYMELLKNGYMESDKSYLYTSEDNLRSLSDKNMKKWEKDHAAIMETARKEAEELGEAFLPDQPGYRLTLEYAQGAPELTVPDENSDDQVLEDYLYRKLVPTGNQEALNPARNALQQMIRKNWPDTASLSRMRKRQINIPRKLLILLFLATDGSDSEFENLEEENCASEDAFLNIYARLNLMLTSCGFLKLDPRSAFDWMILFCIAPGDLWESDERIQSMLLEMFSQEK